MSVYIAARDLAGFPIGTHQYIVIVNKNSPYPPANMGDMTIYARSLGGGKTGYVVGAHNRRQLVVEYFEKNDYQATLEHFDKSRRSWYKSDFDAELIQVRYRNTPDQAAVKKIFFLINNYHVNQSMDKIKYPAGGFGFNSNSWAQTVIQLSGGKVPSDMGGADIANRKRIPKTYFDAICPVNPRPKLN